MLAIIAPEEGSSLLGPQRLPLLVLLARVQLDEASAGTFAASAPSQWAGDHASPFGWNAFSVSISADPVSMPRFRPETGIGASTSALYSSSENVYL